MLASLCLFAKINWIKATNFNTNKNTTHESGEEKNIALMKSIKENHLKQVEALILSGADVNYSKKKSEIF